MTLGGDLMGKNLSFDDKRRREVTAIIITKVEYLPVGEFLR